MEDAMIDTQGWIIKLQKGTMPWLVVASERTEIREGVETIIRRPRR
jgi:hypothetical protein